METYKGESICKGFAMGNVIVLKDKDVKKKRRRADDSDRLLKILQGREEVDFSSMGPSIIVAEDLSPGEMMRIGKEKILAFVTVHGSANSHTAILARMMNIPALVGVAMDLRKIHTGTKAVVDGFCGEVIFQTPEETRVPAQKKWKSMML